MVVRDNSVLGVRPVTTLPTVNLLKDTDGFLRPRLEGGTKQPISDLSVRESSLLCTRFADVRSPDAVFAYVQRYAVTLAEIFNDGAKPYDGWDNLTVMTRVMMGEKMEQPACPAAVWNKIFVPCFAFEPEDRPTFAELDVVLDSISIDGEMSRTATFGDGGGGTASVAFSYEPTSSAGAAVPAAATAAAAAVDSSATSAYEAFKLNEAAPAKKGWAAVRKHVSDASATSAYEAFKARQAASDARGSVAAAPSTPAKKGWAAVRKHVSDTSATSAYEAFKARQATHDTGVDTGEYMLVDSVNRRASVDAYNAYKASTAATDAAGGYMEVSTVDGEKKSKKSKKKKKKKNENENENENENDTKKKKKKKKKKATATEVSAAEAVTTDAAKSETATTKMPTTIPAEPTNPPGNESDEESIAGFGDESD